MEGHLGRLHLPAVRACMRVLAGCRRQRVNKLSALPTRQTERERERERERVGERMIDGCE